MLLATLLLHTILFAPLQTASCAEADSCRTAALEAAGRGDFEAFHDLAWRAAQKGRPNDPALMYLLARAQSLSGRPGDALVMLRRLADMGAPTDARDNEDFRRVRALPGWPAVEALMTRTMASAPGTAPAATSTAEAEPPSASTPSSLAPALPAPSGTSTAAPSSTPSGLTPAPPKRSAAAPGPARRPAARPPTSSAPSADPAPPARAPSPEPAPPARAGAAASAVVSGTTSGGEDALTLTEPALEPIGLAYDSASRRFVVGDRHSNKLIVADEVFRHVNDLIGAAAGGFGSLNGVEIDTRRGDLWVASSAEAGAAAIHKLQLVSGRLLATIPLPDAMRPAALGDLAITDAGDIIAIDSVGARLFTIRRGETAFGKPLPLDIPGPRSIAPAGETTYVANPEGLIVIDLRSGRARAVSASAGLSLSGLRRIRWTREGLVAIQADTAEGPGRLVRIRVGSGGARATRIELLDNQVETAGTALTISRDAAYYVVRGVSGPVIRRVPLR